MKTRRWIVTVTACLLVFAGLAIYKVLQIRAAIAFGESFPEPSETVEAVLAESHRVQSRVTTLGEIVAPQMISLRNEIEGRIAEINFQAGAIVKREQVLLQLDVSEETAGLQSARASARLAQLDLQRIERLRESQTASQESLDQARAQYAIARADIQAQQAIINKKTLRAPFDAYAGLHALEPGEFLEANALVTTLVGINDFMWVDFNLPYHQGSVDMGTEIEVMSMGRQDTMMSATIIARDSVLSAASRNLRFRARLQLQQPIPPNAVVNVSVPVGSPVTETRVPATAIKHDILGNYVYVLEADGNGSYRARRRVVTLGVTLNSTEPQVASIATGLEPNELVAANGAFKLGDGLLVYVKERQPVADASK